MVQMLAVIAEPFSFFTREGNTVSPASEPIRSTLGPYVEFAYLNHGYFFFAPNPGPSYLLECTFPAENGTTNRFRLPDRNLLWPRLLYHRHFMLSDFLNKLHAPPITQADLQVPENIAILEGWRADRQRFEMVRDSMVNHLKWRYKVPSASIYRVEHRLPSSAEVFDAKIPLNDERLYVILPDSPVADVLPAANATETPTPKPAKELIQVEPAPKSQP
jgi:hypothetical protein